MRGRFGAGNGQFAGLKRALGRPEASYGPSKAYAGDPMFPFPGRRQAAASLTANLGVAGEPRPKPATGPFIVSKAIRTMFAMLPPGLKLASVNPDGGV